MKAARRSIAALVLVFAVLLPVLGFISDIGGALQAWKSLVDWVRGADASNPAPYAFYLLSLIVFIMILALLATGIARLSASQVDNITNKEVAQRLEQTEEKARQTYLDWLNVDVENRLRASIHRARLIEIGNFESPDATNPFHYSYQDRDDKQREFSSFDEALAQFQWRILLLGEPGSGKTTVLLHIAQRLIQEARNNSSAPIPLLLNLSKLAASRRHLHHWRWPRLERADESDLDRDREFERWLVDQTLELPIGDLSSRIVRRWVEEGRIALLLDGLDEAGEQGIIQVAQILNRTILRRYTTTTIVVCSRIIEYQELRDDPSARLRLNGAVTLKPLNREQIDAYLEKAGATALRDALPSDAALYELAKNPLTLSMMTLAYGGMTQPLVLPNLSLLERRYHLLDAYVNSMMQRTARRTAGIPFDLNQTHNQPTRYSRRRVNRYLSWLALRLSERMQTVLPYNRIHHLLDQNWDKDESRPFWSDSNIAYAITAGVIGTLIGVLLARIDRPPLTTWQIISIPIVASLGFLLARGYERLDHQLSGKEELSRLGVIVRILGVSIFAIALFSVTATYVVEFLPIKVPHLIVAVVLLTCIMVGITVFDTNTKKDLPLHVALTACSFLIPAIIFILRPVLDLAFWYGLGTSLVCGQWVLLMLLICGDDLDLRSALQVPASITLLFLVTVIVVGWIGMILIGHPNPFEVAVLSALGLAVVLARLSSGAGVAVSTVVGLILGNALVGPPVGILTGLILSGATGYYAREPMQHGVERLLINPLLIGVVAIQGQLPIRCQTFLRYSVETMLLKQSGADYEFVHRLLRDHFAVRALTPIIQGAEPEDQIQLIENLSRQGESALDILMDRAKNPSARVREAAIKALGRIATRTAVKLLEDALDDPDIRVRRAAVTNVRRLTPQDAQQLFRKALREQDEIILLAVAENIDKLEIDDAQALLDSLLSNASTTVLRQILIACVRRPTLIANLAPQLTLSLIDRIDDFLQDPDPKTRKGAVELLGHINDERAEQALISKLSDPDRNVAMAATDVLIGLGSLNAIPELRQIVIKGRVTGTSLWDHFMELLDPTSGYKLVGAALKGLGMLRVLDVIDVLNGQLRHAVPRIREETALTLGRVGAISATSGLCKALHDPITEVRLAAASSLGKIGNSSALTALITALDDRDKSVRVAIITAIGNLMDASAEEALRRLLRNQPRMFERFFAHIRRKLFPGSFLVKAERNTTDNDIRFAVVKALEAIKARGSRDILIEVLRSDPDNRVRSAAAQALCVLENPAAVEPLIEVLRSDPDNRVRSAAAQALCVLENPAAVEPLIEALREVRLDQDQVRKALVQMMRQTSLQRLTGYLGDMDLTVCMMAGEVIGDLGDQAAVGPLLDAIHDPRVTVSGVAAKALAKLDPQKAIPPLIAMLNDSKKIVRQGTLASSRKTRKVSKLQRNPGSKANAERKQKFSDGDTQKQQVIAASVLGILGDQTAVEPLLIALSSKAWKVRSAAVEALGVLGDQKVAMRLMELIDDSSLQVRVNVAASLANLDYLQALPLLLESLERTSHRVTEMLDAEDPVRGSQRVYLSQILDDLRVSIVTLANKASHVDQISLIKALHSKEVPVRIAATEVLSQRADSTMATILREKLNDKDKSVQYVAAIGLGRIGDPSVISVLLEAWRIGTLAQCVQSAEVLGKLKAREAVIPLLAEDRTDTNMILSLSVAASNEIRQAAVDALTTMGSTIKADLQNALHQGNLFVRCAAARALGRLEDPTMLPDLREALLSETVPLRYAAAQALGLLRNSSAVPELTASLTGATFSERCIAADALGKIGGTEAVAALMMARTDIGVDTLQKQRVCDVVENALRNIALSEKISSDNPS